MKESTMVSAVLGIMVAGIVGLYVCAIAGMWQSSSPEAAARRAEMAMVQAVEDSVAVVLKEARVDSVTAGLLPAEEYKRDPGRMARIGPGGSLLLAPGGGNWGMNPSTGEWSLGL